MQRKKQTGVSASASVEAGDRPEVARAVGVEPPPAVEEHRIVLLDPEYEGDAKALLVALIVIAGRLAREQQTVVESSEAGELAI
jgi:hypothetical protein